MENNYYSNFKCHNKKGNRLSILGRKIGNQVGIWILECSKHDRFNKILPKRLYKMYIGITPKLSWYAEYHPKTITIDIKKGDSGIYTFNQYCIENYYKKQTITCLYNVEMLKKGNETKIVNVTKKKVKI